MAHQTRFAITLVVLAVAFAASSEATKPTTTFADYLASKKATPTPAIGRLQESYDEYVEVEHACLKEISHKNCRGPSADRVTVGAGLQYFESGVTCCDSRGNSGNSLGSSALEVGSCKFNHYWFSTPIEEAPGVMKYGEFTAQCYLNAASESCDGPMCDQMVLTIQGGIYYTDDIILASRPIPAIIDSSCKGENREFKLSDGRILRGKKGGRTTAKIAGGVDATTYDSSSKPSLYSGTAMIFFGPMTVNSRFHSSKYTQGWYEFVYYYEEIEPVTEAEAEGKHIIDPYTHALKFYKPSSTY